MPGEHIIITKSELNQKMQTGRIIMESLRICMQSVTWWNEITIKSSPQEYVQMYLQAHSGEKIDWNFVVLAIRQGATLSVVLLVDIFMQPNSRQEEQVEIIHYLAVAVWLTKQRWSRSFLSFSTNYVKFPTYYICGWWLNWGILVPK